MKEKGSTSRTWVLKILLVIASALSFVWFLIPVFWGVKNIGNVLGMCVSVFVVSYLVAMGQLSRRGYQRVVKFFHWIVGTIGALGAVWVMFLTACMVYGAVSKPPEDATVVVLGCQVKGTRPSQHLQGRIEAAAHYLQEHPQAVCVASGGQGNGEDCSEAQVIYDHLVQFGIAPQRIVREDASTNTQENLRYSLSIIREKNWSEHLAIVTDEYHEFRAGQIARKLGVSPYAVVAHSPWYTFSANYVRELLAITKEFFTP